MRQPSRVVAVRTLRFAVDRNQCQKSHLVGLRIAHIRYDAGSADRSAERSYDRGPRAPHSQVTRERRPTITFAPRDRTYVGACSARAE